MCSGPAWKECSEIEMDKEKRERGREEERGSERWDNSSNEPFTQPSVGFVRLAVELYVGRMN